MYEGNDFVKNEIKRQERSNNGEENSKIGDPFDLFGYGVVAYFKTVKRLMFVYAIISILLLPVFYIYHKGGFLEHSVDSLHAMQKLTFGNMKRA